MEAKRDYEFYRLLEPEKYPEELKRQYKKRMGRELDLQNPEKFSEKIQWLKLYDRSKIRTQLADKYLVRD